MADDLLYVISLRPVDGRPFTPELVHAHVEHLRDLDRQGRLVLAGPLRSGRGGLVVVRAGSEDEARALAARDPFVTAGVRIAEVDVWDLAHAGNDYLDWEAPQG